MTRDVQDTHEIDPIAINVAGDPFVFLAENVLIELTGLSKPMPRLASLTIGYGLLSLFRIMNERPGDDVAADRIR
ncbi:hypothetical protein FG95_03563 [Sphingopyxis sp. LC363]|nr:hypothetical protein FG95_03563 [Sphingopyxis sp. LC363]